VAKLNAQAVELLPTPEPTAEIIPIAEAAPVATEAKPEAVKSEVDKAPTATTKGKKK